MRFLRIKHRLGIAEGRKVGVTAEEEEEGRRSLLISHTASAPCSNVEPAKIELPDLKVVRLSADSSIKAPQQQAVSATQVVTLKVFIHCYGCARRVKKALAQLQGVKTSHIDMDQQKLTVVGNLSPDEVLQNVNKLLEGTQLWPAPVSADDSSSPN